MSSAGKISSSPTNTKMPTYRFVLSALVAATTLIGSAHAHMVLTNPVPYGKPQTAPLSRFGFDYPCQQAPGVYDPPSTKNEYTTGGEIDVSFGGSASHGGGSCQFAITTEKQPTLNTVWQVIYSIEGGCPVKGDTAANTSGDNYTVPIPSSVAAGDYTFAWTWYNKVGNRELYMNCAPITVKPGGSTKRAVEARKANPFVPKFEKRDNSTMPDLWLANICNEKCTTGTGKNAIFPSPGAYTTGFASSSMETETCSCARSEIAATVAGSGAAPTGSASSGSSGSDSSGSSGSGSSGSAASDSVATSAASVAATSAAGSSGEGAAILSTAVATETVLSTAAAAAATGSSDMSGSSSSSSNTTSSSGACTGTLQCSSDGTQFALCGGPSVIYQAVAPGTKCADGNIVAA